MYISTFPQTLSSSEAEIVKNIGPFIDKIFETIRDAVPTKEYVGFFKAVHNLGCFLEKALISKDGKPPSHETVSKKLEQLFTVKDERLTKEYDTQILLLSMAISELIYKYVPDEEPEKANVMTLARTSINAFSQIVCPIAEQSDEEPSAKQVRFVVSQIDAFCTENQRRIERLLKICGYARVLNLSAENLRNTLQDKNKDTLSRLESFEQQEDAEFKKFLEYYDMLETEAKYRGLGFLEFCNKLRGLDRSKTMWKNFDDLMQQTVQGLKQSCSEYEECLRRYQEFPRVPTLRTVVIEMEETVENEGQKEKVEGFSKDVLQEKRHALQTTQSALYSEESDFQKVQSFRKKLNEHSNTFTKSRDSAGKQFILLAVNIFTFGGFNYLARKNGWKRFTMFSDKSRVFIKLCQHLIISAPNLVVHRKIFVAGKLLAPNYA